MSAVKKTYLTLHSPGPNYDPEKHITLDELRELGLSNLPDEDTVPGCAWVSRTAMMPDPSKITVTDLPDPKPGSQGKMKVTMQVGFAEALTWETTKLVIDGDVDLDELQKTLDDA